MEELLKIIVTVAVFGSIALIKAIILLKIFEETLQLI